MKLSETKKAELYSAIADAVMVLRIEIQQSGSPDSTTLDYRLCNLQNEVWKRVHKALNLDGPA